MPTVATGGGHILNIDFFVANLSRKRRDKGRRSQRQTPFLLKCKVGVNLVYPKVGEIDPYAIEQMDQTHQSSKGN